MIGISRPAVAFYPSRELNNDPTNWWAPNLPALHGMLRDVGFDDVRTVTDAARPGAAAPRAPSFTRMRGVNTHARRLPPGSRRRPRLPLPEDL